MRGLLRSVLPLCALGLVGCDTDTHGVSNPCAPPGRSAYSPTAVYAIAPNASFEVPPTEANPWFGITSNGTGTYHLAWTDPIGDATCFTGLVTVAHSFATPPVPSGGAQEVLNDPMQFAFSGVPGSATEAVDFYAGEDEVDVEAYIDQADTTIDLYYTNDETGVVSLTSSNVAAFQSP